MEHDDHEACWQRSKEIQETIDWKWKEFKKEWDAKGRGARLRIVDRIDKARSVIRSLDSQIDYCLSQQRGAKSWEFESRVQGWIDEKRAKIADIESSIARDEEKLRDIDRSLNR